MTSEEIIARLTFLLDRLDEPITSDKLDAFGQPIGRHRTNREVAEGLYASGATSLSIKKEPPAEPGETLEEKVDREFG